MAMAMAMARSALGRVARGRHPVSQQLLPARASQELSLPSAGWMPQLHPGAAGHMGKRYLSDGKSDASLVDYLRKHYFKVSGRYYKVDSAYLMLDTANGIDTLRKSIEKSNRDARLLGALVLLSSVGVFVSEYTLQKETNRLKKKCSDVEDQIKVLFDRAAAAGIKIPIHVRLP